MTYQTPAEMVHEFHVTYGAPIGKNPVRYPANFDLRLNLLMEEAQEYVQALADDNFIEQIDALADIVYVAYGALLTHGVPVEKALYPSYNQYKTVTNFTNEIIGYARAVNSKPNRNWHTRTSSYTVDFSAVPEIEDIVAQLNRIIHAAFSEAHKRDVDLFAVLKEVHSSNMSKLGEDGKPIYREKDNKILKGPNFRQPDIAKVIAMSRYERFYNSQPEIIQAWLTEAAHEAAQHDRLNDQNVV